MNRAQLAHLLRSACRIVDDPDVLVMGSQAILGTYDEDDLPPEATASMEADLAFLDDPDRAKADEVDAVIGELSTFQTDNGVYAEGIHVETAVLPKDWRLRLTHWEVQSSLPARPWFLDPHDLAIGKLVAAREKDTVFVDALLRRRLLDVRILRERVQQLPDELSASVVTRIEGWLDYYDDGAGRS